MCQMTKLLIVMFAFATFAFSSYTYAEYEQGCADPEYQQYIEQRFSLIEARNRRLLGSTQRDYEISVSASNNLYLVIASLSRHLKYSAQFEPVEVVEAKIDRIFEHANTLSVAQQIAGDVFDGFSSETHSVAIARAWIAYRQGQHEAAFDALLGSIDVTSSALLSTFGPDFELVRQMYRDGHVQPVIAYITKTEQFWTGKRPDELRNVWLRMIEAKCKIQFDSIDVIKAQQLGLTIVDLSRDLGLSN